MSEEELHYSERAPRVRPARQHQRCHAHALIIRRVGVGAACDESSRDLGVATRARDLQRCQLLARAPKLGSLLGAVGRRREQFYPTRAYRSLL